MLDPQLVARCVLLFGEGREHVVIIDDAVLENFDEPGALVRVRSLEHGDEVLVDVDRARDEPAACAEREGARVRGGIDRAERSRRRPRADP